MNDFGSVSQHFFLKGGKIGAMNEDAKKGSRRLNREIREIREQGSARIVGLSEGEGGGAEARRVRRRGAMARQVRRRGAMAGQVRRRYAMARQATRLRQGSPRQVIRVNPGCSDLIRPKKLFL